MRRFIISMVASCFLLAVESVLAESPQTVKHKIGSWCVVEYPGTMRQGQKVKTIVRYQGLKQTRINCDLHGRNEDGSYAGLKMQGQGVLAKGNGQHSFAFTIPNDSKLADVKFLIYLSPDGIWTNRTESGDTPWLSLVGDKEAKMVSSPLGKWGAVKHPQKVYPGKRAMLTIVYKGLPETKLTCDLHGKNRDGAYGGVVAQGGARTIKGDGEAVFSFPVPKRENLKAVQCLVFTSKDGSWQNRDKLARSPWIEVVGPKKVTMRPLVPEDFIVVPGTAKSLKWSTNYSGDALEYTVADYTGRVHDKGRLAVKDGTVAVELTFSTGYHEIAFPQIKKRFGVAALAVVDGARDPFFCVDAALSCLLQRPDSERASVIRMMKRCGIAMVRERVGWVHMEHKAGKWDWNCHVRYEALRKQYQTEGIPILDSFEHAPEWQCLRGENPYPYDLYSTMKSWTVLGKRWQSLISALEVWNEPELFAGKHLPADQLMPIWKTIAYTFQENGIPISVGGPGLTGGEQVFRDSAAENGLFDLAQFVSYHTYCKGSQMERGIDKIRSWATKAGHPGVPLWITECGKAWPTTRSPRPSAEHGKNSALHITMKGVESKACGIDRYFAFVFPFYAEGKNTFAMLGKQYTPLRDMVAYAYLIRTLSHMDYIGDLELPGVDRARVFQKDTRTVVVLFKEEASPADSIAFPVATKAVHGIDGRPLDLTADQKIPLKDGLVYVRVNPSETASLIKGKTRAAELRNLALTGEHKRVVASPIILQHWPDLRRLAVKPSGYIAALSAGQPFPFPLRVHNLSDSEKQVSVVFSVVNGDSRQVLETRNVSVPGAQVQTCDIDLAKHAQVFSVTDYSQLVVEASSPDAGVILPLVANISREATVEQVLPRYQSHSKLPIADVSRWRNNINSNGKMEIRPVEEGGVEFHATFGKGDKWMYPSFHLPENVDMTNASALVIRTKYDKSATMRVYLWDGENLKVGYRTIVSMPPAGGDWHTVTVPLKDFQHGVETKRDPDGRLDLSKVRHFSVGFNTNAPVNTLHIAELYVVEGEKKN